MKSSFEYKNRSHCVKPLSMSQRWTNPRLAAVEKAAKTYENSKLYEDNKILQKI